MPHLLFRGVPTERLQSVASPLAEELAALCGCGTDNFTMNCLHTTNVFGCGSDAPAFAFVEIGWFERGQQVRDSFALAVTRSVQKLGINEIEVVFQTYREDSYYINGEPCSNGS